MRGLDQNTSGFLCYLFFWVSGAIFYLLEKENRFVRFHALQSMASFGGITVLLVLIRLLFWGVITAVASVGGEEQGWLNTFFDMVNSLLWLALLFLWALLMLKAYQGEEYTLPLVGEWAKKQVGWG